MRHSSHTSQLTQSYFPQPYPDEVIGSLLIRASRHLGLSFGRLLSDVIGANNSASKYFSFFLSGKLARISILCGVPARVLLYRHTVFPYITAFLSTQYRNNLESVLLSEPGTISPLIGIAALIHNATKGGEVKRFCQQCIEEEIAMYGESYWHRLEQLPGIIVCTKHKSPLYEYRPIERTRTQFLVMPQDCRSKKIRPSIDLSILLSISQLTRTALTGGTVQDDRLIYYKQRALEKGYGWRDNEIASRQLTDDIRTHYKPEYLDLCGCPIERGKNGWPELMVRLRTNVPFAPIKHILLDAYLGTRASDPAEIAYKETPRKARYDFARLDHEFTKQFIAVWTHLKESKTQSTAWGILKQMGAFTTYKHGRNKLPKLRQQIVQFRESQQSSFPYGFNKHKKLRNRSRA